ncbi:hypothetical protein DBV15_02144 [Temnothorax longispinosus]|uniref:Uncharacterized protein n=1 Tax=Temnothorax longispinosus TaxID=300112 RepID=A0A4S2JT34_9HYME|nr:hypothetical protein DBV15_02144 [Temnothorax longispinosus]
MTLLHFTPSNIRNKLIVKCQIVFEPLTVLAASRLVLVLRSIVSQITNMAVQPNQQFSMDPPTQQSFVRFFKSLPEFYNSNIL